MTHHKSSDDEKRPGGVSILEAIRLYSSTDKWERWESAVAECKRHESVYNAHKVAILTSIGDGPRPSLPAAAKLALDERRAAWDALDKEFRSRGAAGEFMATYIPEHISDHELQERDGPRRILHPGYWNDLHYDYENSRAWLKTRRYKDSPTKLDNLRIHPARNVFADGGAAIIDPHPTPSSPANMSSSFARAANAHQHFDEPPASSASPSRAQRNSTSSAKAERDCEAWLTKVAHEWRHHGSLRANRPVKSKLEKEALTQFAGLSKRAFARAWNNAAPAEFKEAGRLPGQVTGPKKSNHRAKKS